MATKQKKYITILAIACIATLVSAMVFSKMKHNSTDIDNNANNSQHNHYESTRRASKESIEKSLAFRPDKDIYFGGNPFDSKVKIVFYGSFSCPFCAMVYINEIPKLLSIIEKEGTDMSIIYKTFISDETVAMASLALLGIKETKKKEEVIYTLYNTQRDWAYSTQYKARLEKIFKIAGIGSERFNLLINDSHARSRMLMQRGEEVETLGIDRIPLIFINGNVVNDDIKAENLYKIASSYL